MHFHESREGNYRIYVGAVAARNASGHIVSVVVNRVNLAQGTECEAYRDDRLACGYRWPTALEAKAHALARALDLIRSDSPKLAR